MTTDARKKLEFQVSAEKEKLTAEKQKAEGQISQQATEARKETSRQYRSASGEIQAAKSQVTRLETLEQRKRDLPITQPQDIGTKEKLAELDEQAADLSAQLTEAMSQIDTAEAEALGEIEAQAQEIYAGLDKIYTEQLALIDAAEAEFKANNVKLATGEWVDKTAYDALDAKNQQALFEMGVKKYNEWAKLAAAKEAIQAQEAFKEDNVKLATGEWVSKEAYDSLSGKAQTTLFQKGIAGYNEWAATQAEKQQIKQAQVSTFKTGDVIPFTKDSLTSDEIYMLAGMDGYEIAGAGGIDAVSKILLADPKTADALSAVKVSDNLYVYKGFWDSLKPDEQDKLVEVADMEQFYNWYTASNRMEAWGNTMKVDLSKAQEALMQSVTLHMPSEGVGFGNIAAASVEAQRELLNRAGIGDFTGKLTAEQFDKLWAVMTEGEKARWWTCYSVPHPSLGFDMSPTEWATIQSLGIIADLVPVVREVHNWNNPEYSNVDRAVDIVFDILIVAPVLKAASAIPKVGTAVKWVATPVTLTNYMITKPIGLAGRGAQYLILGDTRITPAIVESALREVEAAARAGEAAKIVSAARKVERLGNIMRRSQVAGYQELVDFGKSVRSQASNIARMAKNNPALHQNMLTNLHWDIGKFSSSYVEANKLLNAAREARVTYDELQSLLQQAKGAKTFNPKLASQMQQAVENSVKADSALLEQLSKVGSVTTEQWAKISKLLQWDDLTKYVDDINKLRAEYDDILKAVRSLEDDYNRLLAEINRLNGIPKLLLSPAEKQLLDSAMKKLSEHPYIKKLTGLEQAKTRLEGAISDFQQVAVARWKFTEANQFKGYKIDWKGTAKDTPTSDAIEKYLKAERIAFEQETKTSEKLGFDIRPSRGGAKPGVSKPKSSTKTATKTATKAETEAAAKEGTETLTLKPQYAKPKAEPKPEVKAPTVTKTKKYGLPAKTYGGRIPARVIEAAVVSYMGKTIFELSPENANKILHATVTEGEVDASTLTEVRNAIQTALQRAIKAESLTEAESIVQTEALAQTKLQLATRTALKTRLKEAVRQIFKEKLKLPRIPKIPRLPFLSAEGRELTQAELEASVAWKQGFMYKLIYPPYGEKNIINTREPISGVKYLEGPRSAYLSLTKIHKGELPVRIQRDMGIMDIEIERGHTDLSGKRAKPQIRFRQDRKQSTTVTPKVGTFK